MSKLRQDLSLSGLIMIVIGSCIGSGIFVTPSLTFSSLPHHGLVLLTWFIGGLITFFGAITFSELSARFPKAGGVYVYLKEGYGPLAGFLYGWIILLIVNTGALAALSVVFTDFLEFFLDINDGEKQAIAIGTLVILTMINVLGVNISGLFATFFTGLKLLALIAIIVIGFIFFDVGDTQHDWVMGWNEIPDNAGSLMLLAFVGVFWSFGGWHHATYLSGEAKNPQSSVPRAMLIGTLSVTVVYLLVIMAYSSLLPLDMIITSKRLAGDAVGNVIQSGGKLVAIGISISIFGTIGIYTMSAPRIYYAMAKDGVFFKSLAKLHPKTKTPYIAMLFQCAWAILLIVILKDFDRLITFATFMDVLFMILATSTIFIFRNKGKDLHTLAFQLKWYPVIPILYLLGTVAFIVNTLLNIEGVPILGLSILGLGFPVYYFFNRQKK